MGLHQRAGRQDSKDTYDPARNPDGLHGVPLPPLAELIEQGKVIALNFPIAMNPGLARALGTMLKQDFQRAVLSRVHTMSTDPAQRRPVMFVATVVDSSVLGPQHGDSLGHGFWSQSPQQRE